MTDKPKMCPHLTLFFAPEVSPQGYLQKGPPRADSIRIVPQECKGDLCAIYWQCQIEPMQRRAILRGLGSRLATFARKVGLSESVIGELLFFLAPINKLDPLE